MPAEKLHYYFWPTSLRNIKPILQSTILIIYVHAIRTETEGNLRELALQQIDFRNVLNFNNKKSDHKKRKPHRKQWKPIRFVSAFICMTHTHPDGVKGRENEREPALFVCKPSKAGKSLSAQQAPTARGGENVSQRQKELKKLGLMEYVLN